MKRAPPQAIPTLCTKVGTCIHGSTAIKARTMDAVSSKRSTTAVVATSAVTGSRQRYSHDKHTCRLAHAQWQHIGEEIPYALGPKQINEPGLLTE